MLSEVITWLPLLRARAIENQCWVVAPAQVGIPADIAVYRAVGCRECRNTGYHGRHAT